MEWLNDVLSNFGEDDYVLFDCPGQARGRRTVATALRSRAHPPPAQIELYSHVTVFNTFSETLKQQGWR